MTTKSGSSFSGQWVIVIAVVGVVMSVGNGFWSLANPHGDIEAVKNDLIRHYARKETAELEIKRIDRDIGKVESEGLRRDEILRGRIEELSKSVNLTYSAKDALASLQSRIIELEKSLRDAGSTKAAK